MFTNRLVLVLGVLSLLLVSLAVSQPFSNAPVSSAAGADDPYGLHPGWVRDDFEPIIPVAGRSESLDYYQRHPKLMAPAGIVVDISDYFLRHSEVGLSTESIDLTDYFLRH